MTESMTEDRIPEPAPEPGYPHQGPDGRDLGPESVLGLGRAAIAMAAVRRRTRHEPGKVTDYTGVRPPTDVMVITSLPRYTRHLPPGAATRHPKWDDD